MRNSRCARDSQCIMRDSREMHSRCAALYTKQGSIRSPIFLPVPTGMPITVDDTTAAIIITAQRRSAFHAQPTAHTLDACRRRSLGRSGRGLLRGSGFIGRRLVIGYGIGHAKKDRNYPINYLINYLIIYPITQSFTKPFTQHITQPQLSSMDRTLLLEKIFAVVEFSSVTELFPKWK